MLYPNKIQKNNKTTISYANRGMDLEYLINEANIFYKNEDIAIIYKKPTPVQINKVSYINDKPTITKGKFNQKSTLDYVGLYKGRYLDFDAKKTLNKTSFPLENLHEHQYNHIKRVIKHGGISFLIIEILNKVYILLGEDIIYFIENNKRKSIPYEYIKDKGYEVSFTYNPVIDYLKVIDNIYFKKENRYEKD